MRKAQGLLVLPVAEGDVIISIVLGSGPRVWDLANNSYLAGFVDGATIGACFPEITHEVLTGEAPWPQNVSSRWNSADEMWAEVGKVAELYKQGMLAGIQHTGSLVAREHVSSELSVNGINGPSFHMN